MALPKRPTAAQDDRANIGESSLYTGAAILPEGNYALEFLIQMHSGFSQTPSSRPSRLGVMVTAHALETNDEPRQVFYSMGSNADKAFAPSPDGSGVIAVPGGSGKLNDSTNWEVFRKSLYDSGLPQGIFTNDIFVLNGIHVHLANQPEPESRKQIRSRTGEAAGEEQRGSGTIAVVTQILDDGKPWEGTGGLPGAEPATKAPAKVTPMKPGVRKPVAAAPAPAPAADADDVEAAAIAGATAVLEKNPNGVSKLLMRTGTFKAVTEQASGEMAQAVLETYFGNDDNLNVVLGQLGYVVAGQMIKPQP